MQHNTSTYSAARRAAGGSSSRSISPAASVKSLSFGASSVTGRSAASNGPSPVGVELYETCGAALRDAACEMPAPAAAAAAECGADGEPLALPGFETTAESTLPPHLAALYQAQPKSPAPTNGSSGVPTPHALAPGCPRRCTLPGRQLHCDPEAGSGGPCRPAAAPWESAAHDPMAQSQASCVSGGSAADHDLLLPPPRHTPVKITTTVYRQGKISRSEALERVRVARERRAERDAEAQAAFMARVQSTGAAAAAA